MDRTRPPPSAAQDPAAHRRRSSVHFVSCSPSTDATDAASLPSTSMVTLNSLPSPASTATTTTTIPAVSVRSFGHRSPRQLAKSPSPPPSHRTRPPPSSRRRSDVPPYATVLVPYGYALAFATRPHPDPAAAPPVTISSCLKAPIDRLGEHRPHLQQPPSASPSSRLSFDAPSPPPSIAPTSPRRSLASSSLATPAPSTVPSSPTPSSDAVLPLLTAPASPVSSLPSPTPPPAPKAKPRSWADLLKKPESAAAPSAASTPASALARSESDASAAAPPSASSSSTAPTSPAVPSSKGAPPTNGHVAAPSKPRAHGLQGAVQDVHTVFEAPLIHPRGLINQGNLCFANAILQSLVYCAPFYNLFIRIADEVPHDFASRTPLMDAVIHFLREFTPVEPSPPGTAVDPLREQQYSEAFVPEFVYDAMKLTKRFDTMRRGHQEDAEEFLGFFLDTLHEELLSALRRSASRYGPLKKDAVGSANDVPASDDDDDARQIERPRSPSDGWMEVGPKNKTSYTRTTETSESPITRIFGGRLRSVLKCPGQKDSVTLEPYQPLQLDIQPEHVRTIEDALANLTVPETIHDVYSPAYGVPVDATKQVFVETLPPILILHLKRFIFDNVGGVGKNQKVIGYGTTLEIKPDVISPARRGEQKARYRLFGVVYHHGKYASGGHYTVDVLRQNREDWIHIDDTAIYPVPEASVQVDVADPSPSGPAHDGLAYLLFYARDTPPAEAVNDARA